MWQIVMWFLYGWCEHLFVSELQIAYFNNNTYFRLHHFSDVHISQGSVATYLMCGGIYKCEFVANSLKQFSEWLSFTWQFASITSWTWRFLKIDILQGSVATCLRCGGMFKYGFIANFFQSLTVKVLWKSVNIWRSYGQEYSVLFFLTHSVYYIQRWTLSVLSEVWTCGSRDMLAKR